MTGQPARSPVPPQGRLVLDVIGVRVELSASFAGCELLRDILGSVVPPDSAPADTTVGEFADEVGAGIEGLLGAAARAAIDVSPHLLVHAGAVARDGQATVFPGASGAGKSSMTAACLRRGFSYLSDEMIAVDLGAGLVRGWQRPLMLTRWSVGAVGLSPREGAAKEAVAARRLLTKGAIVVAGQIPVAHVISMRRGAAISSLTPMSAAEMLSELLASSFNHFRFGALAWEAAVRLVSSASCWRLDVADLSSAADIVTTLPRTVGAVPRG